MCVSVANEHTERESKTKLYKFIERKAKTKAEVKQKQLIIHSANFIMLDMKSCLKISYQGEVSFIICDAGSNYERIIEQGKKQISIH